MKTTEIRKLHAASEPVAVVARQRMQQSGGILQYGVQKGRIVEVFPEPQYRGYHTEKPIARVEVESNGKTYEVSARRIVGSWAEREAAEEAARVQHEKRTNDVATKTKVHTAQADRLNQGQIDAGLVDAYQRPFIRFDVDEHTGALTSQRNANSVQLAEALIAAHTTKNEVA